MKPSTITRAIAAAFLCTAMLSAAAPGSAADPINDGQWYASFLRLPQAHKVNTGAGVSVAVVDSGIEATHPDLAGSVLPGKDLLGNSDNGQVDTDGHGTAMASLIAGHGRIQGVAPQAKLIPVRVNAGSGISAIADAIKWAAEHEADIISVSLATYRSLAIQLAVQAALARDIVVVAAVGNVPYEQVVGYPAAHPGVLAVAGVDAKGRHSTISVTGPQVVICAPSDHISSARPNGRYGLATGTSDATAMIAGAAALLRAEYPDLSARDIVHRLTATAVDNGPPGRDNECGYGVVDIVSALTADVPPLPPESALPTTGPPVPIGGEGTLAAPGAQFPVDIAVGVGAGCLAVLGAAALLAILVLRRRRA